MSKLTVGYAKKIEGLHITVPAKLLDIFCEVVPREIARHLGEYIFA
jgi:hypothetical protein